MTRVMVAVLGCVLCACDISAPGKALGEQCVYSQGNGGPLDGSADLVFRRCDSGLWCDGPNGDHKCHRFAVIGESCAHERCAPELACDFDATCKPLPGPDQPCVGWSCAKGLVCSEADRFCKVPRAPGEGCADAPCEAGAFCNASRLCEATVGAGDACVEDGACTGGRICNFGDGDGTFGHCRAPQKAGGPCGWRFPRPRSGEKFEVHGCAQKYACVPEVVDPLAGEPSTVRSCGLASNCFYRGTCQKLGTGAPLSPCTSGYGCVEGGCATSTGPCAAEPHPGFLSQDPADPDYGCWVGAMPGVCSPPGAGESESCSSGSCAKRLVCSALNNGVCLALHRQKAGGSCAHGDSSRDPEYCAYDLGCEFNDGGHAVCMP